MQNMKTSPLPLNKASGNLKAELLRTILLVKAFAASILCWIEIIYNFDLLLLPIKILRSNNSDDLKWLIDSHILRYIESLFS